MCWRKIPQLIAALPTLLLLCGAAPHAGNINWRLFLSEPASHTPLRANFCFRNSTEVGNYYGIHRVEYALALNNYFAAGAVQNPVMCFTRFPSGPGRAHLYGGEHGLSTRCGADRWRRHDA
jgi:hypothetical protein